MMTTDIIQKLGADLLENPVPDRPELRLLGLLCASSIPEIFDKIYTKHIHGDNPGKPSECLMTLFDFLGMLMVNKIWVISNDGEHTPAAEHVCDLFKKRLIDLLDLEDKDARHIIKQAREKIDDLPSGPARDILHAMPDKKLMEMFRINLLNGSAMK